jgi:hypothetical protein
LLGKTEAQQPLETPHALFGIRRKQSWYKTQEFRRDDGHRFVAAKLGNGTDEVDAANASSP